MRNNFCEALSTNDRQAIGKALDDFLQDISTRNDPEENFEKIRKWIAGHECVSSVETSRYLIDTDPPIKEFVITLHTRSQPVTIGITLNKDKWRFNKK